MTTTTRGVVPGRAVHRIGWGTQVGEILRLPAGSADHRSQGDGQEGSTAAIALARVHREVQHASGWVWNVT